MLLQVFLNDLSTPADACSQEVAVAHLRNLVAMVRKAGSLCDQFVVNLEVPLADLSFGPGWPLRVLRNASECREESVYLKTIEDRSPLGRTIAALGGPPAGCFDYRLDASAHDPGRPALALGCAHRFDGLALSFSSHAFWRTARVGLERDELEADGSVVTASVEARNACAPAVVEAHRTAILEALRPSAADGEALWANRGALFPNLSFAPRVQAGIARMKKGQPTFEAVRNRLGELDGAVGRWRRDGSARPSYASDVTAESSTRMHLVWFDDGSGTMRCFSEHARFTPGKGRIHFILESAPHRHALVGHVGDKIE